MGRPPTYNLDDVFTASTSLFREQGFHQVSVTEILSATGLNRFALYEKFGGKEGLFYDTLDYYHRVMVRGQLLGPLYRESASLNSVVRMFKAMRRINRNPDVRPGCLIMNANIELGGGDERVAEALEFVIGTFQEAIEHALVCADRRGELNDARAPRERAARAAVMIQAFFSLAYISREGADQLLAQMLDEVETWRSADTSSRTSTARPERRRPVLAK